MNINKKIIIISLSFGLVLSFLIIFGIFPIFKNIKENSEKLLKGKEELAIIKNKIENSGQIEEIYQKINPSLQKIDGLFVNPQLPIDLIKFWEKTAGDCGVSIDISNITTQKPAEGEQKKGIWMPVSFQMTIEGSFSGFSKFLDKIENGPYLVEAQDVMVKKLSGQEIKNGGQSSVSAILTLNAFSK